VAPDQASTPAAGPIEAAVSASPAPPGSQDVSAGAARIGTLAPLLTRLIEALPGRALLVWREQIELPWQLVQVHEAVPAAEQDDTHDPLHAAARGEAPAVGLRVLHPLGPPYPALADWLAAQTRWPCTDVIAALGGHTELGPRVLPLDSCTAVVWLEPQAGGAASAAAAAAPPLVPEPDMHDSADRERETFLYTVSHDLRAPIRVIEGFTRIVKEDYGALLDRVGNDHLDRVLGASTRMTAMINALLALSRLSTQALQHELVDLSALAAQVMDELQRQAPERRADISIEPGLQALGDPALLRLVLDNLLGNAWKYSVRRELTRISLSARPALEGDSSRRLYTVQDNGAGFDMRFAERLFGPFQRLHSAREFAGTGVGLATVRRIVRRHGGDVWADAEVDRGASFHFTLD
jgi:signal transduction histidine kinase